MEREFAQLMFNVEIKIATFLKVKRKAVNCISKAFPLLPPALSGPIRGTLSRVGGRGDGSFLSGGALWLPVSGAKGRSIACHFECLTVA